MRELNLLNFNDVTLTTRRLQALSDAFDAPRVRAILLVGSYARGEAGRYSDVDVLRLVEGPPEDAGSRLWHGKLVSVSNVERSALEIKFTQPQEAIEIVAGLRLARVLRDKDGSAHALLERARAFIWTPELQRKADRWASVQLVGWAEEAHKGLAGLQKGDPGRLLNARFGLSWGLARVMRVQRGLLARSDNSFLTDLEGIFAGTRWLRLLHESYGLTDLSLAEQVRAGLELYCLTAELLDAVLQGTDRPLIENTVHLIRQGE